MALIKCIECQNEISDSAISCPHCGKALKEINSTVVQLDQAPTKRRKYKIQYLIFAPMFFFGALFTVGSAIYNEGGKLAFWFLVGLIGFIGMIYSKIRYWLNKP